MPVTNVIACFEIDSWEEALLRKDFPGMGLRATTQPLGQETVALARDFDSEQALQRIRETTAAKVQAFLGGQPKNMVGGSGSGTGVASKMEVHS